MFSAPKHFLNVLLKNIKRENIIFVVGRIFFEHWISILFIESSETNSNWNRCIIFRFQLTTQPITVPLTSSSFSRRRPPPPGSTLPIISSLTSSTLTQSSNSQQLETQTSPVTLAAPRPETERLANEYVDTPFRTPKLSRLQHAGVHSTHR